MAMRIDIPHILKISVLIKLMVEVSLAVLRYKMPLLIKNKWIMVRIKK